MTTHKIKAKPHVRPGAPGVKRVYWENKSPTDDTVVETSPDQAVVWGKMDKFASSLYGKTRRLAALTEDPAHLILILSVAISGIIEDHFDLTDKRDREDVEQALVPLAGLQRCVEVRVSNPHKRRG